MNRLKKKKKKYLVNEYRNFYNNYLGLDSEASSHPFASAISAKEKGCIALETSPRLLILF